MSHAVASLKILQAAAGVTNGAVPELETAVRLLLCIALNLAPANLSVESPWFQFIARCF
jgi:hypothetical protein